MRQWTKMVMAQGNAQNTNSQGATVLTTPFMLAHGAGTLRMFQALKSIEGQWNSKASYRFAAVRTSEPGAWTNSATARTTDGKYTEDFDISATTNMLWVQGRVVAWPTSGVAGANVRAQAAVDTDAQIVASTQVVLNPQTNSGEESVIPLGEPFPALGLAGLMGAFLVGSVTGTLTYKLVIRYFSDAELPEGTWNVLATRSSVTTTDIWNSSDQATSPGTNLWAQAGLLFSGTNARATVNAVISGRY